MSVVPQSAFPVSDEAKLVEILRQGVLDADDDRPAAAERVFRDVFVATRDSGTRVERLACSCLEKLFARQDRDIEALVLARRHVRLAESLGDVEASCLAYAGLADAFVRIEDWPRLDAAMARLATHLGEYRGRFAAPLRRCLFRLRAERALAHDDVAAAREAIERLAAVDPSDPEGPEEARATRLFEADLALRADRPDLAREALARAAAEGAPTGGDTLEMAFLAVTCTLAIDGPAVAASEIGRLLDRLDAPDKAAFGTASRVRCARRLAHVAATGCRDAALAKRAYDVAAGALLLRAAEIELAVRELPEWVTAAPADAATLVAYRRRFADSQRELLASVAGLLLARAAAGRSTGWTNGLGDGAVRVCAWCLRVRLTDGTVLPLGHFVSGDPSLRISHGICGECESQVTATRHARVAGPDPETA